MPQVDREELRTRAQAFVESDKFASHYEKLHIPAWIWYVGQLIRCATVIGLPGGLQGLLKTGKQVFASADLMARYRQLVHTGRLVKGFVVINNTALHGNPNACAPALVVASLAGTDEGDAIADDLCVQIIERILFGQMNGKADETVQAMIADQEYQAFRKRPLPMAFTGGREAHFLDVKIDNELLRGESFLEAEFYFLVDPSPRGLVLQIPQGTDAAVPQGTAKTS